MPADFPLRFSHLLFSLIASLGLCQCASQNGPPQRADDGTYWASEPGSGPTKIVISLDEQRVGLFKGGQLVGLSPISSGREGYDTHPGNFRVTEKDVDHRSSLYGAFVDQYGNVVVEDVSTRTDKAPPGTRFVGADMRYFMRFNGAIGMHQGYLPGYPASHGCIRLLAKMAPLFFEATPHGTPVEVRSNASLLALRPIVVQPEAPVVKAVPSVATTVVAAPDRKPSATPKPLPVKRKGKSKLDTLYLEGYGPN
jgi:hypothetical protein